MFAFVAPTGPPVNVSVSAVNASRISVSWVKPSKSVLHGNLIRYDMEYRRVMCNESEPVSVVAGSWKTVQVANTSVSMEIGNLVFWSCYEVRMRAVTVSKGTYSDVIEVRTTEHGELLLFHFYRMLDDVRVLVIQGRHVCYVVVVDLFYMKLP